MSEKIPVEIQREIIERIPDIKWVIQYRSVSKAWKCMIDSKEFVTGHTLRRIPEQPRYLLIRGQVSVDSQVKYVSIVDDDTFPHQKFSLFVPVFCKKAILVGSSHGLFCLYDDEMNKVIILNPSIRKSILITVVPYELCLNIFGFGVCDNTLDPKIVKISYDTRNANPSTRVEVFTLSLGAWRSPLSDTCPRKSIGFGSSWAVVDGFIYWGAFDRINEGGGEYRNLIMSFDLKSEEFTELYLPTSHRHGDLYVSNLRESLGVIEYNCDTLFVFQVWIMKGCGFTRSFEKLYGITPSDASIGMNMILGFSSSGAFIVERGYYQQGFPVALAAYEPESKEVTEIWRAGIAGTFCVHPYMETLLLLGH